MVTYTAISVESQALTFVDVTADVVMTPNTGYNVLVNSILIMPEISERDDVLRITNFDATGFTIQCNPGEAIFGLSAETSTGGSIVAVTPGTSLYLVCLLARTEWQILSGIGELQFN